MTNNGGPAFPPEEEHDFDICDENTPPIRIFPGTLRDWFAGQIMMGMYARGSSAYSGDTGGLKTDLEYDSYRAKAAYEQADAMIKVRGE